MSRIFHIATAAEWAQAQQTGRYTTSTRGRTLAEEGFIHASRADQWEGVRDRYYADVDEPLLLLVIDPDRLTVPLIEEPVAGPGSETYPHIYGPLSPDAVLHAMPLDAAAAGTAPPAPTPTPAAATTTPFAPPATSAEATAATTTPPESFSRLFLREMIRNVLLALVLMAIIAGCVLLGGEVEGDKGPLVGLLIGLVVGIPAVVWIYRRRAD